MANIRRSRAGGFIRGGRHRRETIWLGTAQTSSGFAATTVAILNSLNAAALALRPFTVVRVRGT